MGRPLGAKDKKPRKRRTDDSPVAIITRDAAKQMPEGYNQKKINFMLDIIPTEPLDYDDVEEMERRFMVYLQKCAEWDMKVGNLAAYAAIGINKDTAHDWAVRYTKQHPERAQFIKKVRQICAMYREGLMADGKINPVTGIFWQKNFDGMKDQQDVVVTPNNPLGEKRDAESLRQKYLENTYGELPDDVIDVTTDEQDTE